MNKLTRRKALVALLGTSAALAGLGYWAIRPPHVQAFSALETVAKPPFSHGVASGDPLSDRVIIWTRLDPETVQGQNAVVEWDIARTEGFEAILASGSAVTGPDRDWTVKVDATGLQPGQRYAYRFRIGKSQSGTGWTRTLPEGSVDQARFAVVSCSNWQFGYFNAYDHIARSGQFDAMFHLGDYIYEYGQSEPQGHPKGGPIRLHDPAHEITSLSDYRTRLAQYRSDPSLQAVTAEIPLIAIWDDHETANNSFVDGAQNHQPDEGSWLARREAALQAYFEWLPVREPELGQSRAAQFRAFEWGDLASIVALETRLLNRNAPLVIEEHYDLLDSDGGPEKFRNDILNDPNREMLGAEQISFVIDTFRKSREDGKPWRLLANQVVMGRVLTPDLNPHVTQEALENIRPKWAGIDDFVRLSGYRLPFDSDSWDGYPVARQRLYSSLADEGIRDVLVITGDAHEYWLNDLEDDAGDKMGIEVGTTSVTSGTLSGLLGSATEKYALLMTRENRNVRYYNPMHNGYVDLTLTRSEAIARLVAVDTVRSRNYGAFQTAQFRIQADGDSLKATQPRGLNVKQYALFRGWA